MSDDSDDRRPRATLAVSDVLTDWILIGPILTRERVVDDCDCFRSEPVLRIEQSAGPQRNAHRFEVSRSGITDVTMRAWVARTARSALDIERCRTRAPAEGKR